MVEIDECGEYVIWCDGEYEGECELPEGHEGHHFDGVSCFTGGRGEGEPVAGCADHTAPAAS